MRLRQGRAEEMTVFSDDPVATGLKWQAAGASWLHVVDLDGAFSGSPQNLEAIRRLREALTIPMELGGGIRTLDTIQAYLDLGLDRLILGTVVLKDPDLAARACASFPGDRPWPGRQGRPAGGGGLDRNQPPHRPGSGQSPGALEARGHYLYRHLPGRGEAGRQYPAPPGPWPRRCTIPVIASGGVSSLADIEALLPLEAVGVVGVITGRALYDGSLDLNRSHQAGAEDETAD